MKNTMLFLAVSFVQIAIARADDKNLGNTCVQFHSIEVCGDVTLSEHQGMGGPDFREDLMVGAITAEREKSDGITPNEVSDGKELCAAFMKKLNIAYDRIGGNSEELVFPQTQVGAAPHEYTSIREAKVIDHNLFVHEVRTPDHTCGTDSHDSPMPKWRLEALSCGFAFRKESL
jgi:hypothetical protein